MSRYNRYRRSRRVYAPSPYTLTPAIAAPCKVVRYDRPADVLSDELFAQYPCTPDWAGFAMPYPINGFVNAVRTELAEGWPDGATLVESAFGQVMARLPENTRARISYGHHHGFAPDVAALYAGRPDVFAQRERRPAPKTVRLICDVSVSGGVAADKLVWSGAIVLALAAAIETSGNRAEVWVSNYGYGFSVNQERCDLVCVKQASDQILPDLLASVLCSPRFYRVGLVRRDCEFNGRGGHTPKTITKEKIEEIAPDLDNAVIVPRVFSLDVALITLQAKLAEIEGAP